MSAISIPKGIIRDIAIIIIGILVVWAALYVAFGMSNPFYVVASGSMVPALEVYDILVVQGNVPFEELRVGDIIVFDRPSDHNRVIVHRVASIIDEDPRTIRTKGDANMASIPGTDFPVTSAEYIGKVEIIIPDAGYVTQALKPPVNYIIIAIIIGIMVSKQLLAKKKKSGGKVTFSETAGDAEDDEPEAARDADSPGRPDTTRRGTTTEAAHDQLQDDSEYVADVASGDTAREPAEDKESPPDIEPASEKGDETAEKDEK